MEEWISRIQAGLREWLRPAATPGAAVAFIEGGRPAAFACAGVRDLQSRNPITPATVFEAASLSKPVFAWAVLRLAAEGGLDLDVPLHDLLPQDLIPGEPLLERLTARHVLSHSSGLPNWLDKVPEPVLRFAPGEGFGYSGE